MAKNDRFIQEAIRKRGALREYVMREYGSEGFDKKGRIKTEVLKDIERNGTEKEKKRAFLAQTLRRLHKT